MFKLTINAGHGLPTAGKHCLKNIDPTETKEWVLNSRVCEKIEAKLKEYDGIEWIRLDDVTGKTDVLLKTRTDKANEFKADFYLSIHHNWGVSDGTNGKGGKGGGIVAYVYRYADAVSKEWQKDLYDECIKLTGLKGNRSTPLHTANFHELRESDMPSVLMECGFMDSLVDTPIILTDKFAEQIATACVNVIVKRAGLTKKYVSLDPTDIQKGDLVAIKEGAYYYGTKTKVPTWATNQKWYVDKLMKDPSRARLGQNEKETTSLNSIIATAYLEPVKSATIFNAGDLVSIASNAKYYGKTKFVPTWVINQNWYISNIKGDRAVLGQNEKKNNNLDSAILTSYLTLVKAAKTSAKKSVHEIALEVRDGKWGNWPIREIKLVLAGYNYKEVQAEVERINAEKNKK